MTMKYRWVVVYYHRGCRYPFYMHHTMLIGALWTWVYQRTANHVKPEIRRVGHEHDKPKQKKKR